MRKIRFDEIGFNVLANTHNMRYALSLKNWKLEKRRKAISAVKYEQTLCKYHWLQTRKTLPCFSLQQSMDPRTVLVISPENDKFQITAGYYKELRLQHSLYTNMLSSRVYACIFIKNKN